MEKQNVTLSLPKALLQKAKLMAVRQDKSLSQLLVEALQEKSRKRPPIGRHERGSFTSLRPGSIWGPGAWKRLEAS